MVSKLFRLFDIICISYLICFILNNHVTKFLSHKKTEQNLYLCTIIIKAKSDIVKPAVLLFQCSMLGQ